MPQLINFVKKINGNVLITDSNPFTIASLSPNQSVYIDETNTNRFIIKSNVNPHEKGLTIDVLTVAFLIDEINNTTINFQGESRETIVLELSTYFFFEVSTASGFLKNLENEILGDFKFVVTKTETFNPNTRRDILIHKKNDYINRIIKGVFIIKVTSALYSGVIECFNEVVFKYDLLYDTITFENAGFRNGFNTTENILSAIKISPIQENNSHLYFTVEYTSDNVDTISVEIYFRGVAQLKELSEEIVFSTEYSDIIPTIAPNYTSLIGIPKESSTDPKRLVSLFLNQDSNTIYKGHNLKYIPFFKHAIDVGSITSFGIGDKLDLADGHITDIGNGQTTTASITNFITNRHNIIFIGVENDFNKLHSAQIYSNEDNQLLIFGHFTVSTINGVTTTTDFVEEISFNLMKGLNNISFPTVATSGNVIACLLKAKIVNSDIFLNGGIYMYSS